MTDTRGKLLDTAERLFAAQGYHAVSLRQIVGEAAANVAAVHYHFGSKEELLDAVVMRKAEPVNRERTARLDRLEAESGDRPKVEKVLEAFLEPMAEVAGDHPEFTRMMGRLQAEGILSTVITRNFEPVISRFLALLRRATPELSDTDYRWRVHFMQGALANAMSGSLNQAMGPLEDEGYPMRIERLIVFLSGAFHAPPRRSEKAVRQSGRNQ